MSYQAPPPGHATTCFLLARVLARPAGQRPRRPTVAYSDYEAEAQTSRLFHLIGYERLLTTGTPAQAAAN